MDLTQQTQLLVNLKQMIEVSHSRGCWKVQEMRDIGVTYNSLCNLLKELENAQEPQLQESVENSGNTENVLDGTKNKVLNI